MTQKYTTTSPKAVTALLFIYMIGCIYLALAQTNIIYRSVGITCF